LFVACQAEPDTETEPEFRYKSTTEATNKLLIVYLLNKCETSKRHRFRNSIERNTTTWAVRKALNFLGICDLLLNI